MTDRERLYNGFTRAAWGYLFLYLDIHLGNVSILPRFVGYLLFLSAIKDLQEARRDLALLRPLGILLALWNGADWLGSWVGFDMDGFFPPLDLLVTVAGMYFHFQFLTDCAALAAAYQPPEETLDRRLLRWRTIQTVLLTCIALAINGGEWLGKVSEYLMVASGVIYLIVSLCLMAAMFALRRLFRSEEPLTEE